MAASERSVFLLKCPKHSGSKTGVLVAALSVAVLVVSGCLHGFGESAERYFPLKQGSSWTYRVSTTVFSLPISGEMKVTNLPQRSLGGRMVVPQTTDSSVGPMLGTVLPKQLTVSFYLDDRSGICEIAEQADADTEPKPVSNCELKYPIRGRHSVDLGAQDSLTQQGRVVIS